MEHGGQIVSVDDEHEVIEGTWPYNRTVLIKVDDREAMMSWYESPGYQAIIGHRHGASKANIVLVKGFQG